MTDLVKMLPINNIKINERYRKELGNLTELVESIREKGVIQPITVNQDMVLLAGERRLTAAKSAGLSHIPALIRDQSKMADATIDLREVELIENVMRKDFTWSERAKLVAEIDRLCKEKNIEWSARKTAKLLGEGHPMGVVRSLQLAEAMEAVPELAECRTQDDAIKLIKKIEESAITAELRRRQEETQLAGLRDVLKLAKSNYHVADALVEMAGLPAGRATPHFIEVDPPYGIELNVMKKDADDKAQSYIEVGREEYPAFIKTVAEQTFRVAGDNCWMIFWFGPTHHQLVLTTLRAAGWKVDEIPAIWNKGHGQTMAPEEYLARSYEPFFVCKKGGIAMNKRGRSNVFTYAPVSANKKYHPTERPVELIEEILETFVGINSVVFIPFLGSGATLRAVYNMGSSGWGYDINSAYRDKFLLKVQDDTEKMDNEAGEDDLDAPIDDYPEDNEYLEE